MKPKPFVIIDPYQFEGDLAFGVWNEKYGGWIFGDSDVYTPYNLYQFWAAGAGT